MMCAESPVEEDSEHPNLEVHLEVGLEEKNWEVHLEALLEQSLSLQDWINSKFQSPTTETQSHMTETMKVLQLEQSFMTKVRLNTIQVKES